MSENHALIIMIELFGIFWVLVGMWMGIGRKP